MPHRPTDTGAGTAADTGPADDGLTRRSLLRVGAWALGGAALTATGIAAGAEASDPRSLGRGTGTAGTGAAGRAVARTELAGPVAAAHELLAARTPSRQPPWVSTWSAPIRSLDPYVSKRVGVAFPRQAIMLTIDDGPHPVWTPKYLALLDRHHIKATFCVIGSQVAANAHLLKAMAAEGHHIANHTFHHPLNLPSLSTAAIRRELVDTTDAIVRASGFRPSQFRAPGGVWGADVFAEVSRQRMMPLGWDIDPRDWSRPGVAHIRSAMLAARPHDIILCHDGGGDRSQTFRALESVVPALIQRGWTFVTLPAPQ